MKRSIHRRTRWIALGAIGTFVAITAGGDRLVFSVHAGGEQTVSKVSSGAQANARFYDIGSGSLQEVQTIFESVSGLSIRYAQPDFARVPTPGVRGVYTPEHALETLLEGTGITYRYVSSDVILLDVPELRQSVDVNTEAPSTTLSSPKYTEPLRNVPQTISVVTQAVIQKQGATTLRDVLRNVTGISIQAGEGGVPSGDNLSIRGFNARTDMFVDGVRDIGGYSRDPFNVEQVEVSKGPSSSYVGRGSTGGSVNLASKSPTRERLRTFSVSGGTPSYQRATFDWNEPVGLLRDAAVRVNGMFTNANTPGRNAVETQRWGLAPSLAFELASATSVVVGYNQMNTDNVPDYGVPWVPSSNIPLSEYANAAPPVSFENFYGLRDRDFENTTTRIGTAQLRRDFSSSFVLQSLFRLAKTGRDSVITAPRFASPEGTDLNRQLQSRDQNDGIAASQTTVTAVRHRGLLQHTIVAGIELIRETSENFARSAPAAPTADLFAPDPYRPFAGSVTRTGAYTEAVSHTGAVFAGDNVGLGEHWQLSGSLRWDSARLEYRATSTSGAVTRLERVDRMWSGRTAMVFKPSDPVSLYLGYGTSLNPSSEGLSLNTSTVNLGPEKSRSFEAGAKWDVGSHRFLLNAAWFRTEKTNARTPGINPGDPPTVLDGVERVNGAELGLSGNITDRLYAMASYTYARSRITQSNDSVEVGREFGNTPRHTLSLWADYRFLYDFDLGGGFSYTGERFNNTNANRRLAEGYWLLDATAGYRFSGTLTLRLNANNLTNRRYIDRVGGGHFVPGPGRMAVLTMDYSF